MRVGNVNYVSLTDLVKYANLEDPFGVIRNWMSNKNSFDYYSLWEEINNENFNFVGFHGIKIAEVPYNLVILNNLQNTNAELIEEKVPQRERLIKLNNSAKRQIEALKDNKSLKNLELFQKQVNENNLIEQ